VEHQPDYIVFLCYGNENIFHECAYSLLTLSALYDRHEANKLEVWIYTDNPAYFKDIKNCPLNLNYRIIDATTIKKWKGAINFNHRVKIKVLADFTKEREGNILYVDTDTIFNRSLAEVFGQIQNGHLYMHVMEGIVSDRENPILKKLSDFLSKDVALNNSGLQLNNQAMWNAGVLGFNTTHKQLLKNVLEFTDDLYMRFPKHIVEQFAFSVFFQKGQTIKAAAPYITHYWNLKEMRIILASFFSVYKNCTWNELVKNAGMISVPVLLQEKANFYKNRNVTDKILKKEWLPAMPNWGKLQSQI